MNTTNKKSKMQTARLRWTTTQNMEGRTTFSGRVHKRNASCPSSLPGSQRKTQVSPSSSKPNSAAPQGLVDTLENELASGYEKLATMTVMFDSLRNAYVTSKPEVDRNKSPTRLCDMEKELLAAYDDLGLQASHLERHVAKLERKLSELRSMTSSTTTPVPADTTRSDANMGYQDELANVSPLEDISPPTTSCLSSPALSIFPDVNQYTPPALVFDTPYDMTPALDAYYLSPPTSVIHQGDCCGSPALLPDVPFLCTCAECANPAFGSYPHHVYV